MTLQGEDATGDDHLPIEGIVTRFSLCFLSCRHRLAEQLFSWMVVCRCSRYQRTSLEASQQCMHLLLVLEISESSQSTMAVAVVTLGGLMFHTSCRTTVDLSAFLPFLKPKAKSRSIITVILSEVYY